LVIFDAMKNVSLENQPCVTDFLSWFQREFLKRRKKNPSYSVRSYANYLGIASGSVSHLLSGKRQPTVKFTQKLFALLDVTPQEQETVIASLKRSLPSATKDIEYNYQMIALDSFKLISDWYHYAILEMTNVKGFKNDIVWIANQLGISVTETRQAIDRLLRLDLLEEKNGKLIKTEVFVTNGDDVTTNSALKNLQRHVLQKALDAVDTVSISEKDISSITMAIDEKKIPEAKKRITKFRRELCRFLEDGEQTRVFNLGIQLYPISKGSKGNI